MFFNFRGESFDAGKTFFELWHLTCVFGFYIANCEVGVAMADLDSDIFVKELVVFFEDLMGSLEVRNEF